VSNTAIIDVREFAAMPEFQFPCRRSLEKLWCILPVDGFFEWKAIKGKAKQPYAIAMKDGHPFARLRASATG
jgi:putative SOS response-associated peptidase YedK